MTRLRPVAEDDLTMAELEAVLLLSLLTRGLGISGWTECLPPMLPPAGLGLGKLVGPVMARSLRPCCRAKASASSSEILNLGNCSDLVWR